MGLTIVDQRGKKTFQEPLRYPVIRRNDSGRSSFHAVETAFSAKTNNSALHRLRRCANFNKLSSVATTIRCSPRTAKTNIASSSPTTFFNAGTPLSTGGTSGFVAIGFATRRRPAHGLLRFQAAGNGFPESAREIPQMRGEDDLRAPRWAAISG